MYLEHVMLLSCLFFHRLVQVRFCGRMEEIWARHGKGFLGGGVGNSKSPKRDLPPPTNEICPPPNKIGNLDPRTSPVGISAAAATKTLSVTSPPYNKSFPCLQKERGTP